MDPKIANLISKNFHCVVAQIGLDYVRITWFTLEGYISHMAPCTYHLALTFNSVR